MESLRHKGSADLSVWSEICAKLLKVLQIQSFPFVCKKTPTLKAAGSNPVGRTRKRGQKRFLVKKLRDFKTSEALG